MASCVKCGRSLPPNGKCVYCGDKAYENFSTSSGGGGFKKFVMRVVNIALVAGFFYGAYWLFFTDPGKAALDVVWVKLKLKSGRDPASPSQEVLARYPKVLAMIRDSAYRIQETKESDSHFAVAFYITRVTGSTERFLFIVEPGTGAVVAQDTASRELLTP